MLALFITAFSAGFYALFARADNDPAGVVSLRRGAMQSLD
jgi:hypothetical protein